ncbi:MAG: DUF5667 domain-containing protein [Anaerolineales bacterium]|jgi:hypothetical protein
MTDKQISKLFAECLEAIEKRGATVEQCLARYPAHRDELRELLSTFQTIQDSPPISPRPVFRQVARIRLENLLPDHPQPVTFSRSIRRKGRKERTGKQSYRRRLSMNWLLIIAFTASLFAGGTGVAYASEDSLPGDTLYGVKNAVEDLQLALSGDEGDVDLLLDFMGEDIKEIEALTEMGNYKWIETALDEYNEDMDQLTQTRSRISYEDAGSEESLNTRIQTQISSQLQDLLQLQTRLQDQTQIQDKLQETICVAENGAGYGPGEGGPNEEPGSPNGAGPGEPQGEGQQDQDQPGKPEDAGGQNQDPGSGGQGEGQGAGQGAGQGDGQGAGTGDGVPQLGGTCDPTLAGEVVEGQNEDGSGDGVYWTCDGGYWQYYQGQGGNGQGQGQGQGQGGKP